MAEFLIELIVAALLVATCGYCFVLSRKLRALRNGQAELKTLIEKFDQASRRAERNLAVMQKSGLTANRDLDAAATRAHALIDELSVMVNAGDHIAGRIEGVVNEVRALGAGRAANGPRGVS